MPADNFSEVGNERSLRRAVADLATCRIEDIESIWAVLSPAERTQLQPLMAEVGKVSPSLFDVSALQYQYSYDEAQLVLLVTRLPKELAIRAAAVIDDKTRATILAKLPQEFVHKNGWTCAAIAASAEKMTPAARTALLEALQSEAHGMVLPEVEASPPTGIAWRRKWRGWFGRSS